MATTKTARATVKNDINTLKDDLKVLGAEEKARLREKATAAEAEKAEVERVRTCCCCCCCSTQRAWSPDPQARGSLSLWTGAWRGRAAAAVQHNAHNLRTPKHGSRYRYGLLLLFNTTRAHTPDPQAQEPLSQWTEVWPTQPVRTQAVNRHKVGEEETPS